MRFLKIVAALIVLIVVAGWAFLYRPWAPYNPMAKGAAMGEENAVYHHSRMDQFFEHHAVKAGAPKPLPQGPALTLPDSFVLNGEQIMMADHIKRFGLMKLAIIRDGAMVFEQHYDGEAPTARYTSWSAAKSFTSTLIGMAIHKGLITSLDDQVTDYLPQLTGTAYEGASIRNVMNMSSGMAVDGLNPLVAEGRGSFQDTMDMMQDWVTWNTAFSEFIADYGRAAEPGTQWNYNNLDTHVLSMLVQEVSGKLFAETVSDWMWTPLNASADATWLTHSECNLGEALGFCCLQATAQDYARLGLLMLNDGVWNGERLLPEGWVAQVQSFPSKHLERGHSNYHLQWWQDPDRPGQYAAKGRWGQAVYISHPDNVVIVRFSIDMKEMEHGEEQWAADAAIAAHIAAQ